MHPEVVQHTPGRCPKCGMDLVEKGKEHKASMEQHDANGSYTPLAVIIGLILLVTFTLSVRDSWMGLFLWENALMYFMSIFFIVFAGFKLVDLKGFAQGYSTYDLLALRWRAYAYIYPCSELFFGLTMILGILIVPVLWAEIVVMTFSGVGVALKLLKHERFQCACLGTFLKVPLTKVTLFEDFGMAVLALVMLILISF